MALVPFDDRDGVIWLDGALVPWRDAKLHVLTHALHYASAVFEGERAYGGQVFHEAAHTDRLLASARIMGFEIPWSAAQIIEARHATLAANGFTGGDAYIRPIAWRGAEMMGVAAQHNTIHLAIACWQWPSYFSPEKKMEGIRLTIGEWRRPDPRTAPVHAKAAGLYMIATLNKHAAEGAGYEDSLMLDWRGLIAEATGANVFFVIDGAIHTPKPDCFLDGITRRAVMEMARKRQMQVIERAMQPEEMAKASECFLTGTAAEITPVRQIGEYSFKPGQVCKTLLEEFGVAVRRPVAKAA
jgi:branched-chain amino acid aminotransferase